mmetsp:Transcript_55851/g.156711  ORF Transcript_55851/g.156711 Transcript_55851/m.156711 type:complete len:200 (+) Transcript_55851:782-1381(+)
MSALIASMSLMVCALSSSNFLMVSSSLSILAWFFSSFQSRSEMVLLIFVYSFSHSSFFSMSDCCSAFRSSTILSMAPMTLSKWPAFDNFTAAATRARRRLWDFEAIFFSASYALRAATGAESMDESCNKAGAAASFSKDLPKTCRASSLVRISRAFEMPSNSSSRIFLRSDHSSLFVWHASLVVSKNSMSALSCASVSS